MASINKAILIGHLGRDPEIRALSNGDKVASFSVATSDSWRDKASGERKERTEWHNVVVFNEGLVKLAEGYLRKGSKVYIEGAIQTRKYQDRDGNERQATEIVLQRYRGQITLLDGKRDGDAPASTQASSRAYADKQPPARQPIDDGIPF